MAKPIFRILWNAEAEKALGRRGVFTIQKIKQEFEAEPYVDGKTFALEGGEEGLQVTPVANNRFSVLWRRLSDANGEVEVSAVLPTRIYPETDVKSLKERIQEIASLESGGRIKLAL